VLPDYINVSNQETVANIPKVFWEDIGGLEEVRKEVLRTVSLPIKFPFLRKSGLKRSGLLFLMNEELCLN
jgi:SpoVK/Ycf46/Vps4 family AAA+-type ATPase